MSLFRITRPKIAKNGTHDAFIQTRRHGRAYRGRAPPTGCLCLPKRKLCPSKRGLCPEEINRLGASGAQIEAQLVITCFRPEKPLEFPISAGKSLAIFAPHLVHLIQGGIYFSCPRAPLDFTQDKLLVPPHNLFLPRQSRYPGAGPAFIAGNCYVESEFQLSRFYRLLVISKSILICQNLQTKPMVLRGHAKS